MNKQDGLASYLITVKCSNTSIRLFKRQIGAELKRCLLCYNRAMKKELMEILVCPVCKGELELSVKEENEKEIISGTLYCRKCDERYPILDTIPSLLPPDGVKA